MDLSRAYSVHFRAMVLNPPVEILLLPHLVDPTQTLIPDLPAAIVTTCQAAGLTTLISYSLTPCLVLYCFVLICFVV